MAIETSQHTYHEQGITLPITTEYRQIAEKFAQQCPFAEKAAQIRLNTLAVCAVNAYLRLMGIATQVEESDSWNPMMQMMANVADLKVPNVGVFSCRAMAQPSKGIAATDPTCHIPPEDWHNRAGYIAVVIDESAHQSTLLGFTPTLNAADIETEQVHLDQFAPIETLIDRIHSLQSNPAANQMAAMESSAMESAMESAKTAVTQLGQWAKGAIDSTWQAVEVLINSSEMNVAFRSREWGSQGSSNVMNISRAKLVDLGLQLDNSLQVALVIHLAKVSPPDVSQEVFRDSPGRLRHRSDIILQVRPLGNASYLPEGVCLSIFDENDQLFRNATSRSIDNYIQIQITGESGETFGIEISKGDSTFKEKFAI
jgi:hypothetical protein